MPDGEQGIGIAYLDRGPAFSSHVRGFLEVFAVESIYLGEPRRAQSYARGCRSREAPASARLP